MKLRILAVGNIKERYFADAVMEYKKRLSRFCTPEIIEIAEQNPKTQGPADIALSLSAEGKRILDAVRGYTIALTIDGQLISSTDLAALIAHKAVEGHSEISFIIGGSNGLDKTVIDRADKKISFGRVTYPHQLMRVILAEQLYRAVSINNNLPYHK